MEFISINGKVREVTQQIGNAVPVPLGIALGKELNKARWQDVERLNERREMSLEI